jgi:hypothetical protein
MFAILLCRHVSINLRYVGSILAATWPATNFNGDASRWRPDTEKMPRLITGELWLRAANLAWTRLSPPGLSSGSFQPPRPMSLVSTK